MATDKLTIYNHALVRLGQDRLNAIDQDSDTRRTLDAIYDQVLEELTAGGPELGWKFATRTVASAVNSQTIVLITNSGETVGDITVATNVAHGYVVGDLVELSGDTGYDGTYTVTLVDDSTSFEVTAVFVASGTGTARWFSKKFNHRFPIPSGSLKIVSVSVGGLPLTDWEESGVFILTNQESTEVDIAYVQPVTTTTLFPPHFTKALWFNLAIESAYGITGSRKLAEDLRIEYDERVLPKAIALDERGKYVREQSSSWVEMGHTKFTLE